MSAANFPACFKDTENWEGWRQFSDDPYDPGSATWCGLTQRSYDAWRVSKTLPKQFVKLASDQEIGQIFHDEYWMQVRGDDLYPGLDLAQFDIGINMGAGVANRFLQQALGVSVDGVFGLETLRALQGVNDRAGLIERICGARMSRWHALTTWWRFGKGWTNRGNDIEARALKMIV